MATAAQQAAGLARRSSRFKERIKWFDKKVAKQINLTLTQRVGLAGQLVRDKTVINLSTPVRKIKRRISRGPNQGKTLTRVDPDSRSKPGEFPRADTTRLMKSVTFSQVGTEARIGTNLGYGLLLETEFDRSFLVRTLNEMRSTIKKILTKGIVAK